MRFALLALGLLLLAGGASAAPTPLTAEALLAAIPDAKTVQSVAGGDWWPQPPSFDTKVFQSDPQPRESARVTYQTLDGKLVVEKTLYAFGSANDARRYLLNAELVGPPVDRAKPAIGEARGYYQLTLDGAIPATRLFFMRGAVGVSVGLNGAHWSRNQMAAIAQPIDANIRALLAGSLKPPVLATKSLPAYAPGVELGTAAISPEAWAMVDRDGSPRQVRDRLARNGAKLLFRRYLRHGSATDVVETTLFTFPKAAQAVSWVQPFERGVENGLPTGKTGSHSAFRHGRDNYELRFVAGRFVGDVFCYAPFVQDPSPGCEAAVRATAERWYAQLS